LKDDDDDGDDDDDDLRVIGCEGVDWVFFKYVNEPLSSLKIGKFPDYLSDH